MSTPTPDSAAPFPVMLDLRGARVLVVGGGEVAAAKCRLLVGTGARVRVVDPEPCADLREAAARGELVLELRRFRKLDLEATRLCYVALDSEAEAEQVAGIARRRGVLTNAVDRPALCDFSTPAIVRRGPITIAIATGGLAPALARNLRARIETAIPSGFGRLAAACGAWRHRIAEAIREPVRRRRFWDAMLDGPIADAMLEGDEAAAGDAFERALADAARGGQQAPMGRVALVGAGPGDVAHLTLGAVRAIQQADVILYDRLVGPGVLELARRDAARVDVGKRCGRHTMGQEAINALILRHARAGARVVRLKGGDPLVFGRAGEEMAALAAAGIPVTVVPGVTTALAAAASLGIPLTLRGVSGSLHFITGHAQSGEILEQDWRALVAVGGTLAVYMGVRTLPALIARLLAAGMDAATPVVAIENATLPGQRAVRGALREMPAKLAELAASGPTLLLIGAAIGAEMTKGTDAALLAA